MKLWIAHLGRDIQELDQQELDALQIFHPVVSHVLSPPTDATILQGVLMVYCDEGNEVKRRDLNLVEKAVSWIGDKDSQDRIGVDVWKRRLKLVVEAFQVYRL